jgi:16S rRNA (cytosine1402-N4)-methyltransferase
MYHTPVMPVESVEYLNIRPGGTYVDATYGGGGHSRLFLEELGQGRLIAFDQDEDARRNIIQDKRLMFVQQNFRHLENYLNFYQCAPVDGIFADLGISSFQIDEPEKGFSYMFPDEMADMRMSKSTIRTAADILNQYSESELSEIFFRYGDLPFSRKLAKAIVAKRLSERFSIIENLLDIIDNFCNPRNKFNVYSRVFQSLRIEVNDEMAALSEMLTQSLNVLKTGGRIVIISYHSLEDRLVKNFFRSGRIDGIIEKDFYGNIKQTFQILTKKPVLATDDEVSVNPRARSAKLRAAMKL